MLSVRLFLGLVLSSVTNAKQPRPNCRSEDEQPTAMRPELSKVLVAAHIKYTVRKKLPELEHRAATKNVTIIARL